MNDQLDKLFADLRTQTLQEIVPPGADAARRTVRRRQGIFTSIGAVVAVGAVVSAMTVAGGQLSNGGAPAGPSASPDASQFLPPQPDPAQAARMAAAEKAMGDPEKLPWVMATAGVMTDDYENHVNDMPADDYKLLVYCVGQGSADVVVKAGNFGDTKLAAGTVACSETPVPGQLTVRQPVDGYLRVFIRGDRQAAGTAAFAFKFVRSAEFKDSASAASTTNANTAAQLLAGLGVPDAKKVTTESDKTLDEPRAAGSYLASFACAGPGKVSFIVRSAKTLRDGTVSTNGQTQTAVTHECTAAGKATKDVAMSLPAGSAFTITAEADADARNKAGWAYAFQAA